MNEIESFINLGIIILLATTIFYVQRLNHKLRLLQAHKESLQQHLEKLVHSLEGVQNHFDVLHDNSRNLLSDLQERLQKAELLRDELDYFSQRAEKQAETLFQFISDTSVKPQSNQSFSEDTTSLGAPAEGNKATLMKLLKRMR